MLHTFSWFLCSFVPSRMELLSSLVTLFLIHLLIGPLLLSPNSFPSDSFVPHSFFLYLWICSSPCCWLSHLLLSVPSYVNHSEVRMMPWSASAPPPPQLISLLISRHGRGLHGKMCQQNISRDSSDKSAFSCFQFRVAFNSAVK